MDKVIEYSDSLHHIYIINKKDPDQKMKYSMNDVIEQHLKNEYSG
jgi:hypothetical protein